MLWRIWNVDQTNIWIYLYQKLVRNGFLNVWLHQIQTNVQIYWDHIFSCPSSSIPTLLIHWLTILNSYQTIPTLVVFALPSTMPHTLMSIQCRTQCSGIIISIRFHNFDRISQFWVDFTVLTKFLKIDKSSQFSAALAPLYVPLTDSLLWI